MRTDAQKFPTELKLWKYEIERQTLRHNLPHREIIYVILDFEEMSEVIARHGFPVVPHNWQYGQESLYWKKYRKYGLGIVYELVVNTDPIYAYLLDCNSLTVMKSVMTHVTAGHAHIFDHNMFCARQNLHMMSILGNDAQWYDEQCALHGSDRVKQFFDSALSLEHLIDLHAPFIKSPPEKTPEEREKQLEEQKTVKRLEPAVPLPSYMDDFLNPPEWIETEQKQLAEEVEKERESAKGLRFPQEPTRDVLKFLVQYAPLEGWQEGILDRIRRTSYYFLTFARTKGIHEGWSSYWEEEIMFEYGMLADKESTEFDEHLAGVQRQGSGLNPYRLFNDLFRDIKFRWDTGRHGKIWTECENRDLQKHWDEFIIYKVICDESKTEEERRVRWQEFSAFAAELRKGHLGYPKEFFIRDFLLRENLAPAWVCYRQAEQELETLKSRLRQTEEIEKELPPAASLESPEEIFKLRRDLFFSKGRKDLWSWTSAEIKREISAIESLLKFKTGYLKGEIAVEPITIPLPWMEHADRHRETVTLGQSRQKMDEAAAVCDDVTFLDEFFTKEFCEAHRYFLAKAKKVWSSDDGEEQEHYVLETQSFERIKRKLLYQYTNFYEPIIVVQDGNYLGKGLLYLKHIHMGVDLDSTSKGGTYVTDVLKSFFQIWGGKKRVFLETIITVKEEEKQWWWYWHQARTKNAPQWPETLQGKRTLFSYGVNNEGKEGLDIRTLDNTVMVVEFPEPF